MTMQLMDTAPKDGTLILVWFDHEADTYHDPNQPNKLTDYATWADFGDFMVGEGYCIASWQPPEWEPADEYGGGYWLPAWWFTHLGDTNPIVANPTCWSPLPTPITKEALK